MAASFNELMGIGSHSEDADAVAWWPLQDDAANTTIADQWSGGHTGTLLGGENTEDKAAAGPNDYLTSSQHLDGGSDRITCGDIDFSGSSASFTFLTWLRADAYSGTQAIVEKAASSSSRALQVFSHQTADYMRGQLFDGSNNPRADSNGLANWPALTWHSLAFVRDVANTQMRMYRNGAADTDASNNVAFTTDFNDASEVVLGGSASNGLDGRWDGRLAGSAIFSRALTAAEISQYDNGPELNYSSGVSFSDAGVFNVGTWSLPSPFASGSNGTPTYSVIAVNAAGTVLDTASTATGTLDLSANAGNTCYLLARASNTGGYDKGDFATRTSGYGSADDGYYEIATVTAAGGGGGSTVPIIMQLMAA